jgi:hypothetical protein
LSSIDNHLHDREVGVADLTQDTTRIDDVRIGAVRPLIVEQSRVAIADILHGRDDRLVVVVGPCSIHDHDQALDYARRLKARRRRAEDDLLIVMRVYFEKPRTTVGWKGYINDPHLDGSFRINEGPAPGAPAAAGNQRARPAHRHRVPRPAEPAIHRRPRGVGRDRRTHHREPEPSSAGVGPELPGRLQERHRRRRAGRRRRDPGGARRTRSWA